MTHDGDPLDQFLDTVDLTLDVQDLDMDREQMKMLAKGTPRKTSKKAKS